jgi:protein gp37
MAEVTKIQWTDHTFNPWIGCAKVSEGCQHCYALNLMETRYHRVVWGPDGTRARTKTWAQPLKWDREAQKEGVKHKVFCASLADVFEDFKARDGTFPLDAWRDDLFTLIDRCQNLHWLLLTKRPENIGRQWQPIDVDGYGIQDCRETVWLGTSISNQRNTEAIDQLLKSRSLAPVLFLSVEPQIGPVNLRPWLFPEPLIHWVIVGGESKQGPETPRPFDMDWADDLVDQCREANVPVFVKQMGSNVLRHGVPVKLRDSHGGDMMEWPAKLRVRECPEAAGAKA